ncbi:cyclin-dependent kinase inhibitor 1B [Octopus vulgaris]|uniref:Cyclin-dependent kinase inhibitor 1B n=1 Tax=Octopus vulgaris TaxID=6645 RepID=A0AA36EZ08_OCTVU|nr:cyclin-dependent kinase inhibitor 1B [Octopus vulgaris]
MKLMEGECIYTPARPSGQFPTPNRRMPQTVINTGSSSGTRIAAQILDPRRLLKARRKLFDGDSEPSSELNNPSGKTAAAAAAATEKSEICQRLLEECQNKWNFDLVNCVPLEGRYEWEKMEPENVPGFYSRPYTNPKRPVPNVRESYSPNMVANGSYSRIRFREDSQSNESTSSCLPGMDVTVLTKLNSGNNDNNNRNNNIATNNTKGCDPNDIYNVPTASISTSTTTCELENTNGKQQDITDVCNDNLTHSSTYSCSNRSSSSTSSSISSNNNNNMGSSILSTTNRQRGKSPLCFSASVKNVNTSNLHGSHEQDSNNDNNINNNNNNNNNVFSGKSDTCDTLTNRLSEQLDNKQCSNLTAIDKATISLPSLSSSSSSSPSYSSSAPSSPSSLSPPSSSPLSSYSSSTLPVSSSSSSTTTKSYSMETLNETKTLPKQTKIVDFMPHRKRTLSYCHTGNREKKLRKE